MYSLTTLRKRAYKAGYRIEKGFQHYMYNDAVCRDCNGDGYIGYNVWDLSNNQLVWESGCYDGNYDHLCVLEDVEELSIDTNYMWYALKDGEEYELAYCDKYKQVGLDVFECVTYREALKRDGEYKEPYIIASTEY